MVSTITDRVYGESSSVAVKAPCVAVARTPNALNGLNPVGSYTPQPGDRILVTAQADPSTNGIYNAATGAWARAGDFDSNYDCVQGTLIVVCYANANGTLYQLTTLDPVIGTTPLVFTPYVSPNITYLQTPAEVAAGVMPTNTSWPEGDLRRYVTSIADYSTAINAALLVSSSGGAAAFIPGGLWPTLNPCIAPPGSSMYGAGKASVISAANGVDGLQFTASDSGIVNEPRFFRDFAITGTLLSAANNAHGIYINAGVITHTLFSNLAISNFLYGAYVQGLFYSTFFNCFVQNCWHGIYFNSQSINVSILDCYAQLTSAGTLITGAGTSTGISAQGSPEVEGLHIQGGSIYGFNYDILLGLIFECQINAVDISNASICPIYFTSVIANLAIRDCWIELGPTASGTFNNKGSLGDGNLCGIYVTPVAPEPYSKIHIQDNNIVCDQALLAGSVAIWIGNDNQGIVCEGNNLYNFDTAIGGGTPSNPSGSATQGASIKHNQITCNTASILINSLSSELDLGPNTILAGPLVAFNAGTPTSMKYEQPNAPMKGSATFVAATSAAVAFANALPAAMASYRVALSGNAAGYCWVTGKTNAGFTINCSASNSNSVDWTIKA